MKKSFIFICLFMILLSCMRSVDKQGFVEPTCENQIFVQGAIINKTLMMNTARDMEYYDNYLIIRAYSEGKYLHVIDKNTGAHIGSFIEKGNGPNEITELATQIEIDEIGNLYWFETNRKRLYFQHIDSIIETKKNYEYVDFDQNQCFIDQIFKINDNYLGIVGDTLTEWNKIKRFNLLSSSGMSCYYYGYPFVKDDKRTLQEINTHYRTSQKIAIAPNKEKMAVAEIYGGILEIFNLNDSICLDSKHAFYPFVNEALHGFVDIYVTNDHIYAIKIDSNMDGYDNTNKYNTILVFDWKGDCERIYTTEYNLLTMCVDETKGIIYAIGQNISGETDIEILSFKI